MQNLYNGVWQVAYRELIPPTSLQSAQLLILIPDPAPELPLLLCGPYPPDRLGENRLVRLMSTSSLQPTRAPVQSGSRGPSTGYLVTRLSSHPLTLTRMRLRCARSRKLSMRAARASSPFRSPWPTDTLRAKRSKRPARAYTCERAWAFYRGMLSSGATGKARTQAITCGTSQIKEHQRRLLAATAFVTREKTRRAVALIASGRLTSLVPPSSLASE